MKKIPWVLWCIMLFSLTACTGLESLNFGTRPSWTNENKLYASTYKVVAKELAIPVNESENAGIWLKNHSMENEEELLSYQVDSGARESNYETTLNGQPTGQYEAMITGNDLTLEEFKIAEKAFQKYGGTLKNHDEPDASVNAQTDEGDSSLVRYSETVKGEDLSMLEKSIDYFDEKG